MFAELGVKFRLCLKSMQSDIHLFEVCAGILTLCSPPPGGAAPNDRSASGLLEWESINDAMEALAMMNHYQMKNAGT